MNVKKFEVWGNDTFANETYYVGTYNNRVDAMRAMNKEKKEWEESESSKSLWDTYWIQEVVVKDNKTL